jgi:hypothetical protein
MAIPIAPVVGLQDHLLKVLIGCRNQGDPLWQFLEEPGGFIGSLIYRRGAGCKYQKSENK